LYSTFDVTSAASHLFHSSSALAMAIRTYMLFKKLASLIPFLLSFLIASVSSCLFSSASKAPSSPPSLFPGKSIVCLVRGTFGVNASKLPDAASRASNFLWRFAAALRTFFDFAVHLKLAYVSCYVLCSQLNIVLEKHTEFITVCILSTFLERFPIQNVPEPFRIFTLFQRNGIRFSFYIVDAS